jgi:hemerythrin
MPLIVWTESLSIGYEPIDEQHRQLVRLINQLHDATALGWGQQIVSYVLDELVDYTHSHFSDEERLMEYHEYPDGARHKQKHDDLARQVLDLRSRLAAGEPVMTDDVMQFLKAWLTDHILSTDMAFGSFLTAQEDRTLACDVSNDRRP